MSRALLLLAACVLPLSVAQASADGSSESHGGKIIYSSQWGANANNSEIYSIGVDGSGRRDLTRDQVDDGDPAWSPNGDRVAFRAYRSSTLYMMRADGSEQRPLTPPGLIVPSYRSPPSWSPDGRRLAFAAYSQGYGIWVVNADGSNLRRLAQNGRFPVWAPHGNLIAFVSEEPQALDVVDADSGERRRVADAYPVSPPTWSPDGQALAYVDRLHTLYRVNTGDGPPQALLSDGSAELNDPAWSPDGVR